MVFVVGKLGRWLNIYTLVPLARSVFLGLLEDQNRAVLEVAKDSKMIDCRLRRVLILSLGAKSFFF